MILGLAGVVVLVAALLATLHLLDRRLEVPTPVPPGPRGVAPAASEVPVSAVPLPVLLDLDAVEAALEDRVPRRFGDITRRRSHPASPGLQFAFQADREDLRLEAGEEALRVVGTVSYRVRIWAPSPLGGELTASCGDEPGEPAPRARVVLSSPVDPDPDWTLRSRIRVDAVEPLTDREWDRCRAGLGDSRVDVTPLLTSTLRERLQEATADMDSVLAGLDLRSRLQTVWRVLQEPLPLGDGLWLALDPAGVRYGGWARVGRERILPGTGPPLAGDGRPLRLDLELLLRPRIVLGDRPAPPGTPLPRLRTAPSDGGEDPHGGRPLVVEGRLDYRALARRLTRELRDAEPRLAGRTVRIRELQLSGRQDGKLEAVVRLEDGWRGRLKLTGTPVLDRDRNALALPDLDVSVDDGGLLLRGAVGLVRVVAPRRIRRGARLPLDETLRSARRAASRELDRRLLPGLRLEGDLASLELEGMAVGPGALVLRVRAEPRIGLRVSVE